MNTSHQNGGAPDVFLKNASAIAASDINANTVCSVLRKKWIELPYLDAPGGNSLSWENLVVNKGKKRVTLQVPLNSPHNFSQEDWRDCEYLHHHINAWFEELGSRWCFRFQESQK